MRGIYIISEGTTEEEFINSSIYDYMSREGINDVRAIKLQTSRGHKGGSMSYVRFKMNILNLLKRENDIIVTSLIDFFRLENDFPKYTEAQRIVNVVERVSFLEKEIAQDIDSSRFVPYIQLHEFEGLLFSGKSGFELFTSIPSENMTELINTVDKYPNPELINEGPTTAPSKRLLRLIPEYRKTFHGPMIALENGFDSILAKCPRFNNWIEILIKRMKA